MEGHRHPARDRHGRHPAALAGAAIGRRSKPWARTIIVLGAGATLAALLAWYPIGLGDQDHGGWWNQLFLVPALLILVGPLVVVAAAMSLSNRPGEFITLDVIATVVAPIGLAATVAIVQASYWRVTESTWFHTSEGVWVAAVGLGVVLTVARAVHRHRLTLA